MSHVFVRDSLHLTLHYVIDNLFLSLDGNLQHLNFVVLDLIRLLSPLSYDICQAIKKLFIIFVTNLIIRFLNINLQLIFIFILVLFHYLFELLGVRIFFPFEEKKGIDTFNTLHFDLRIQHLKIPWKLNVRWLSHTALRALIIPYQVGSNTSQTHYASSTVWAYFGYHRQFLAPSAKEVIISILAFELDQLPLKALVCMVVSNITLSTHDVRDWSRFVRAH